VIYLDSSALLKLVRHEDESPALRAWLHEHGGPGVVTSELGRVEVLRAARRHAGEAVLAQARRVVDGVDLVPLHRPVQDLACEVGVPALRSLDALHLASALLLGQELTAFVAYDTRLAAAAQAAGLPTAAPGEDAVPD
jgi:predicted nucleic acid-binding protein